MSAGPPRNIGETITLHFHQFAELVTTGWNHLVDSIKNIVADIFVKLGLSEETNSLGLSNRALSVLRRGNLPQTHDLNLKSDHAPSEQEDRVKIDPFEKLDAPAEVRQFGTLIADSVDVALPAIQSVKDWVESSLNEVTTTAAKTETQALVKKLLDLATVDGPDSSELRDHVKAVYVGFQRYISTYELTQLVNDNFPGTTGEEVGLRANLLTFIESLTNLESGKVDFEVYFKVPAESRVKFHELVKEKILPIILSGETLKPTARKLEELLRAKLVANSGISTTEQLPPKQAQDRAEKLLYPLLDVLEGLDGFIAARTAFREAIQRRFINIDIPQGPDSLSPLYAKIMADEGNDDPLSAYLKGQVTLFEEDIGERVLEPDEMRIRSEAETICTPLRELLLSLGNPGDETKTLSELCQTLLPKLLSSERHISLLLGDIEKAPPDVDPEAIGAVEQISALIAPQLIEGIFEQLMNLEREGKGVRQALDAIVEKADTHMGALLHAESMSPNKRADFSEFIKQKGCHPVVKSRDPTNRNDPTYRAVLHEYLENFFSQMRFNFLSPAQQKEIFRIIYENREQLKPLLGGKELSFVYDVTTRTLIKDEATFVRVAEIILKHNLDRLREPIVNKMEKVILDIAEPARFQTLLVQKVLPPFTRVLKTSLLSIFFEEELGKEGDPFPLSTLLMQYTQGTAADREQLSEELLQALDRIAGKIMRDEGVMIDKGALLEAQTDLLMKFSHIRAAANVEEFRYSIDTTMRVSFTEHLISKGFGGMLPSYLGGRSASLILKPKMTKDEVRQIALHEREVLIKNKVLISDEVFEDSVEKLYTALDTIPEEKIAEGTSAIKSYLELKFDLNRQNPYGRLINKVLDKFIGKAFSSTLGSFLKQGVSYISGSIQTIVVDALAPIREAPSPLGKVLSLVQPALTEILSRENIEKLISEETPNLSEPQLQEAFTKETNEISILLRLIAKRNPWFPNRAIPSKEDTQKALIETIKEISDASWKVENLLLLGVDAISQQLSSTH